MAGSSGSRPDGPLGHPIRSGRSQTCRPARRDPSAAPTHGKEQRDARSQLGNRADWVDGPTRQRIDQGPVEFRPTLRQAAASGHPRCAGVRRSGGRSAISCGACAVRPGSSAGCSGVCIISPRVVCARTAPHNDVIEQCANHSISVIALHWLVALGGGVLVGAGVGAALAWSSVRKPLSHRGGAWLAAGSTNPPNTFYSSSAGFRRDGGPGDRRPEDRSPTPKLLGLSRIGPGLVTLSCGVAPHQNAACD
jgi:hypothetical protein